MPICLDTCGLRDHGTLTQTRPAEQEAHSRTTVAARGQAGTHVHMARKSDQVSWLRFLHDGTHCPSCLGEFHAPFAKIYGRQGRAGVSYGTLQLPTPAVDMGSADHKTIEAAHNRLGRWQQTQGPRLPSADDGPTDDFVNDIDLAVEIVSYLDDPPPQS